MRVETDIIVSNTESDRMSYDISKLGLLFLSITSGGYGV
jgi:hypothetical protein